MIEQENKYIRIKTGKYPKVIKCNNIERDIKTKIDDPTILNKHAYNTWLSSNGKCGYEHNDLADQSGAIVYIASEHYDKNVINRPLYPVGDNGIISGAIHNDVFYITKINMDGEFVSLTDDEIDMLREQFGRQSMIHAHQMQIASI